MPHRLLITGRAGSGKTRSVLSLVVDRIQQRREGECLLLLPTQSQVDHVKGLLLREGRQGFHDDFAHTFFTLARSLVRDLPEELLPDEGRDYLIGDLLRVERFPSFEAVRTYPGFRELLGRALKELKENGVVPETYPERVLAPLGGEARVAERHRDLGKAFAAYERLRKERRRIDQEDLTLGALARLEKGTVPPLGRRLLLVDGFHDFTPAQFRILTLLSERVEESIFTLSFDAEHPDHPAFAVSRGTREGLLRLGFKEEVRRGNRRTAEPTLLKLESDLFSPHPGRVEAGEAIRILRTPRRQEEIESLARSILHLVREEGVPYRDIAVLYHDLSEVSEWVEGTFRRFGIPVRVYGPRRMDRQPLVRFLLDLGRILAHGPDEVSLLRFLRSGYVIGLLAAEVDRLDQHLREKGAPPSASGWHPLSSDLGLSGIHRTLAILSERAASLRGQHGFRTLLAGWLGTFEELALPLGEEGPRGGDECAALEAFRRLVEEAEGSVQGKGKLPLGLLLDPVEAAAAEATFRIRDRRREVVNVIDAYEARGWEVPYLFVAGLLERQFPPMPMEDLFFDDDERKRLSAAGLRFPGRDWMQSEERLLFYTALTRARSRLHLSHPVSDGEGNPTLPSFFLSEVGRLFTKESLEKRTGDLPPSAVLPPPDEMASLEDVDRAIFLGMEERFGRQARPRTVALAAALYQRRILDSAFRERLASLLEEVRPVISDSRIREEMATLDIAFSNSSLTSFLQCPYLHFTEKWLRLEALPDREVTAAELGVVIHATLKEWLEAGSSRDPRAILDRNFREVAERKRPSFRRLSDWWRLRRALERFAPLERRRIEETGLTPTLFEKSFGTERSEDLAALPLEVDGRKERLSGRIDRVDLLAGGRAGVVVDYKYSAAGRVREQFKAGVEREEEMENFQIALYLLALREVLGIEPAGAELVALKKGVERFGVGRRVFTNSAGLSDGAIAGWELLGEEEFQALLNRAREAAASLVRRIRSGEIRTFPRDPKSCGPGSCDVADVCRFDQWLGGKQKGE